MKTKYFLIFLGILTISLIFNMIFTPKVYAQWSITGQKDCYWDECIYDPNGSYQLNLCKPLCSITIPGATPGAYQSQEECELHVIFNRDGNIKRACSNQNNSCNFGSCGQDGCSSIQRKVTGNCTESWFNHGEGCYEDQSCKGGGGSQPSNPKPPTVSFENVEGVIKMASGTSGESINLHTLASTFASRELKQVDLFVARIPEPGESNLKYVRVDDCPLGFTGTTQGNNTNWCYLVKASSKNENDIQWKPTRDGTYRFMVGAIDKAEDQSSSYCGSNYENFPATNTGIGGLKYATTGPYKNGQPTRYYKCSESGKDVLVVIAGTSQAPLPELPFRNPTGTLSYLSRSISGNTFDISVDISVGSELTIRASGKTYGGNKLKGIDVFVAKLEDSAAVQSGYSRISNCPLGFTGTTVGKNTNWCYLLKGSTKTDNDITFTPTGAGKYHIIMGVYDDRNGKLPTVIGQCSSNYLNFPVNALGYAQTGPYIEGKPTRYYKCDFDGMDSLTFNVGTTNVGTTQTPPSTTPTPTPAPTAAPTSAPVTATGYTVANSPTELSSSATSSITSTPVTISYSLPASTTRTTHTVFVRFFYSNGQHIDKQQSIIYNPPPAPTAAPVSTSAPVVTPAPTIAPASTAAPTAAPTQAPIPIPTPEIQPLIQPQTTNTGVPASSISGPKTSRVDQTFNITSSTISPAGGIQAIYIYLTRDQGAGARIDGNVVDNFDSAKFNCPSAGCIWYKVATSTSTSLGTSLKIKQPGKYTLIMEGIPNSNPSTKRCSGNPYVNYPISTGGLTFYNCGSGSSLRLEVSP